MSSHTENKTECWVAFTDGSASPNPGPGGAGAVVLCNGKPISEIYHTGGHTTNNRMELYALIMVYPCLPKDVPVILHTDSQYVQKGLTEWIRNWVKNNWQTAGKKPVKNKDLWIQLLACKKEYPNVTIKWIKAHHDSLPIEKRTPGWMWNERADQLANEGTKKSKLCNDTAPLRK